MTLVQYSTPESGIGLITLNDPERLNAMSEEMADEFVALTKTLKKAKLKPRVLILTGTGKAFSAGGRLEMLDKKRSISYAQNKKLMKKFYSSFLGVRDLGIPLIAMINGAAVGAGLCVASACDIRIAAHGVKLGFTFSKLGLFPGMGATYFLPRLLGVGAATELLITGRIIQAEEALRLGLVSKSVSIETLYDETLATSREILSSGPDTVKQLLGVLRGSKKELTFSLDREASFQSISYASNEFAEGISAAPQKRAPSFLAKS